MKKKRKTLNLDSGVKGARSGEPVVGLLGESGNGSCQGTDLELDALLVDKCILDTGVNSVDHQVGDADGLPDGVLLGAFCRNKAAMIVK